ncbi:hypothetical protein BGZ57DRAFT_960432 [Hyaloscypha finlandica]|nr:hypothetical protein BGZ57DRAFT_960432 [Hyaloscypha finlandica]
MVGGTLRRLLGLQPRSRPHKEKILGYQLDVELFKSPDTGMPQPWHSEAAYIPTNDRNLLSQTLAHILGLCIGEDGTADVYWKRKQTTGSPSYLCKSKFTITTDLPKDVIFGKFDGMLQGFPSPFEAARHHEFDASFDFSRTRASLGDSWQGLRRYSWQGPRKNSWQGSRKNSLRSLAQRTISWESFYRPKVKSRQSSFHFKMDPQVLPATTSEASKAISVTRSPLEELKGKPESKIEVERTENPRLEFSRVSKTGIRKVLEKRGADCMGTTSSTVDLARASSSCEGYWNYDEELKAYYHIDSDTGSTYWYEDSVSEELSDES